MVPIESSQGGTVQETVFQLCRGNLEVDLAQIQLEVDLQVQLSLVGNAPLKTLRVIYSHPQGLFRAADWLEKCAGHVKVVETSSTAQAARVASRSPHSAALASRNTAALFGLKILKENVGRSAPTTFVVLGPHPMDILPAKSRESRTSLVFTLRDRPGSLARALLVPSRRKINLTRILSIPIAESPGEYMFLVEWSGGVDDRRVREALDVLRRNVRTLKLLGSYPLIRL